MTQVAGGWFERSLLQHFEPPRAAVGRRRLRRRRGGEIPPSAQGVSFMIALDESAADLEIVLRFAALNACAWPLLTASPRRLVIDRLGWRVTRRSGAYQSLFDRRRLIEAGPASSSCHRSGWRSLGAFPAVRPDRKRMPMAGCSLALRGVGDAPIGPFAAQPVKSVAPRLGEAGIAFPPPPLSLVLNAKTPFRITFLDQLKTKLVCIRRFCADASVRV